MLTKIVFGLSIALVLGMASSAMAMTESGTGNSSSAVAQQGSAYAQQGTRDFLIFSQR